MRNIENKNLYGMKEVPDIYFCDDEGEVLYFSNTLVKVSFKNIKTNDHHEQWAITTVDPLGDLQDWLHIQHEINNGKITTIFLRTYARNADTGEDEPYCLRIKPYKVYDVNESLSADGEPFNFNMSVSYYIPPKRVNSENCPEYGRDADGRPYITSADYGGIKMDALRERVEKVEKTHSNYSRKRYI